MRRLTLVVVALLLLAVCSDPTDPVFGDPEFSIVSGNDQEAWAGESTLNDPLEARVVQTAQGTAMLIGPRPLHAQVETKGVPDAVVCVEEDAIEGTAITPDAPCKSTDGDGRVSFTLHPPTVAGVHANEVRAQVGEGPLTPDTVRATVVPGFANELELAFRFHFMDIGDTLDLTNVAAAYDVYGNPLPNDRIIWDVDDLEIVSETEFWDTLTVTADGRTADLEVLAVRHLEEGWTYDLRCEDGIVPDGDTESYVDSLVVTAVVDSVMRIVTNARSAEHPDHIVNTAMRVLIDRAWYYPEDEPKVIDTTELTWYSYQMPGEIVLMVDGIQAESPNWRLMTADDNPPTAYTGGGMCGEATEIEQAFRAPS